MAMIKRASGSSRLLQPAAMLYTVRFFLAIAILVFSQKAACQVNYAYRGALSNNFRMELTLSGTPAAGSVTGNIRSGTNMPALVRGTYSGGTFTGVATYGG